MKREILDDNFHDDFRSQLAPNEKIIWEGAPYFNLNLKAIFGEWTINTFFENIVGLFVLFVVMVVFILPILFLLISTSLISQLILLMGILFFFGNRLLKIYARKKTKYIITNKRIIFQLWKEFSATHNYIRFSAINNLVVTQIAKNNGVIFLAVKNPSQISFDTYDLSSGERRHQPTLEMIENVEEVANYIKLGIQGKL